MTFSQNPMWETKPFTNKEEQDKLTCCAECTSNYEKEVGLFKSNQPKPSSLYLSSCNTNELDKGSTQLPCWLQSHGTEACQKDNLVELRRKWNKLCQSLHQERHTQNHLNSSSFNNQSLIEKSYPYISSYPWWHNQSSIFPYSNSISFADSTMKPNQSASSLPRFRRQQSCHIEFSFSNGNHKHQAVEPNLDSLKNTEGKEVKITLALGTSLFSNARRLVEQQDMIAKLVEENVPWQSEHVPSIVEAFTDSKSMKKESWLLIEGNDLIGKRRLACAIAESVLGSADLLLSMNMRNGEYRTSSSSELLERALRTHEKLVVLVEDIDFADTQFIKFLADGFETGKFGESSKKEGSSGMTTVFILTKGDHTSHENGKKELNSVIQMKLQVNDSIQYLGTPNQDQKRKAEWELSNKAKSPRTDGKEDISAAAVNSGITKKEFTRQLSSNTLDLNIRADEDEEDGGKPGELSPISSDLTHETGAYPQNPLGFLELIKNRFVFNRNSTRDGHMREMLMSKIEGCFEEECGSKNMGCFTVEEKLLEEMLIASGCFLNSLFEKWVDTVFQTSLQTVKIGGKENKTVRLCFGGKEEVGLEDGFMGSSLPKKIQVQIMDLGGHV